MGPWRFLWNFMKEYDKTPMSFTVTYDARCDAYDMDMINHKRHRTSIHRVERRLTARSREVSKPRDSGLDFSNRFEIW